MKYSFKNQDSFTHVPVNFKDAATPFVTIPTYVNLDLNNLITNGLRKIHWQVDLVII